MWPVDRTLRKFGQLFQTLWTPNHSGPMEIMFCTAKIMATVDALAVHVYMAETTAGATSFEIRSIRIIFALKVYIDGFEVGVDMAGTC